MDNDALSRGAAIAFYAATSLAPVLLIVVAIAGLVFGQDAARGAISEELGQLLGPTGGDFIKSILERSSDPGSGILTTSESTDHAKYDFLSLSDSFLYIQCDKTLP